jgi:hypothetical protein
MLPIVSVHLLRSDVHSDFSVLPFYMILFVIIHGLIFRLAKLVFLYLQMKFRAIFFCFTPENHENLATFVSKLTRT